MAKSRTPWSRRRSEHTDSQIWPLEREKALFVFQILLPAVLTALCCPHTFKSQIHEQTLLIFIPYRFCAAHYSSRWKACRKSWSVAKLRLLQWRLFSGSSSQKLYAEFLCILADSRICSKKNPKLWYPANWPSNRDDSVRLKMAQKSLQKASKNLIILA